MRLKLGSAADPAAAIGETERFGFGQEFSGHVFRLRIKILQSKQKRGAGVEWEKPQNARMKQDHFRRNDRAVAAQRAPVDMVGHAQGGELAVQAVTKRSGFVTGNDLPARVDLLLHPQEKIFRSETLGRLGRLAVVLQGHDALELRHVQCQLEHAGLRKKPQA